MGKPKGRRGAYKKKTLEQTIGQAMEEPVSDPVSTTTVEAPIREPEPALEPEPEPDPEQKLLDDGMGWGFLDHYAGDDGFKEPSHNVPFGTSKNRAPNVAGMWQLLHEFFDIKYREDGKIDTVFFKKDDQNRVQNRDQNRDQNRVQKPFFVGRKQHVPSYSPTRRVFSESARTESGEKYETGENPLSKKKGYFCEISLHETDLKQMAKMALYVILSFCGNYYKSFTDEELDGLHCMTVEPRFKWNVGRIRIWVDDVVNKQKLESELTSHILDGIQGYTISTDRSWTGTKLSTNV